MPHLEVITHRTRLGSGLLLLLSVLTRSSHFLSSPVTTSHHQTRTCEPMRQQPLAQWHVRNAKYLTALWDAYICSSMTVCFVIWLYRLNTNSISQQFGHGAPRVRKSSWGSTLLSFQAPCRKWNAQQPWDCLSCCEEARLWGAAAVGSVAA